MTHQTLFWSPVALRFALVSVAGLATGYLWGALVGLLMALLVLALMLLQQLFYMYRLSAWLEDPERIRLDDGGGAWTEIFAKLYRMRREDQKNRAELAEWLSRFRQAMSQLPDGVVIMDDVLFLEWCNPVAEQHLGLSLATDKGMRVTNLIRSPEFIDYIILGRYEEPLTLAVDDRKLIVRLIPFENRRHILVSHDVTDFERLDQMRRDFIANASHELRTPLTVINGFLEIAANQPELDTPTRTRHMKLMFEQGQRMQHLVEDMLVLTRLESMDYPLREEEINIRELLEKIEAEANALSAGRHQISLVVNGPDLRGNTEELRSAIGNLVSNAVRYTPDGGQVEIQWSNGDEGPRCIVSDTGIGISQEDRKSVV
jgi:two-component system phosphate regulon sensor histidine kinase PhoR